jgi:hypothetical protein
MIVPYLIGLLKQVKDCHKFAIFLSRAGVYFSSLLNLLWGMTVLTNGSGGMSALDLALRRLAASSLPLGALSFCIKNTATHWRYSMERERRKGS